MREQASGIEMIGEVSMKELLRFQIPHNYRIAKKNWRS